MNFNCPVDQEDTQTITMAHGAGGRKTAELIDDIFLPAFQSSSLALLEDAAVVDVNGSALAMTTDSFVVSPLVFPGGDLGELAVTGTVNDLAMKGAKPKYLTAGFILEEGLPLALLKKLVQSMADTAHKAGVSIVAGDTKVVERGKGDGIFINTAGIGEFQVPAHELPAVSAIRPGDCILLSRDIGRHGVAVMASRSGIGFETGIESDCALLSPVVEDLYRSGISPSAMRDLTRGGLATALIEMAESSNTVMEIQELNIPVHAEVQAACEVLGLNPLYVANEGAFVLILPEEKVDGTMAVLKRWEQCESAATIGRVGEFLPDQSGKLVLKTSFGVSRRLNRLMGEQLPRIC